jgi:L-aminopeptidase/D-esterase-like protein
VGSATDETVRSGVTVVLCPGGWTAGVDVRGGGPGVRETETLSPENGYARAHAVTLSGGSVFGLGAADGVVAALSAKGEGFLVRPGAPSVPIVPGAVLYDLANGGDKAWGLDPPYRRLGAEAVGAAGPDVRARRPRRRTRGAGRTGPGRTGLGLAGSGRGPDGRGPGGGQSGRLGVHARRPDVLGLAVRDRRRVRWPRAQRSGGRGRADARRLALAGQGRLTPGANTTLAVVAVNAALTAGSAGGWR